MFAPNDMHSDGTQPLPPNDDSSHVNEPEMVDVRDTPQYQEYLKAKAAFDQTVAAAKAGASSSDEGTSRMLADNPALQFQGAVTEAPIEARVVEAETRPIEAKPAEPIHPPITEPTGTAEQMPFADEGKATIDSVAPADSMAQTTLAADTFTATTENVADQATQPADTLQTQPTPATTTGTPTTQVPGQVPGQAPLAAQTSETQQPEKPKKEATGRALGLFSGLLVLLFIGALGIGGFLVLPNGQEYIASLGLDQSAVTLFTALISGLVALLAFIGLLLGTFKMIGSRKDQKQLKRRGFVLAVISTIVLIFSVVGLILSFSGSTDSTPVAPQNLADLILTDPMPLRNLTAPVEVTFDATQIPFDSSQVEIISHRWDFGDGGSGTGSAVTHLFERKPETGVYNTTLSILYRRLSDGEQIAGTPIVIPVGIVNEEALINFTMTPGFGAAPLTVSFDASSSSDPDGELVAFEWDFDGDQEVDATGDRVQYEFTENGSFPIRLTVTDSNGAVLQTQKTLVLEEDGGFAITYSTTPNETPLRPDISYLFDASGTTSPDGSTIIDYTWDFSDTQQLEQGRRVNHTFAAEGVYSLRLRVTTDSGRSYTKEFSITVGDLSSAPVARITALPEVVDNIISGTAPLTVAFSGNESTDPTNNIIDYSWDFNGDGIADQSGANAEFTFREPGSYRTVLTLLDAEQNKSTAEVTIVVATRGVNAVVTADPVAGETPLTVTFDASSTTSDQADRVVAFEWEFGDGTPVRRDNAQVTYVYKNVGTYIARVTAITESGQRDTQPITINVNPVSLKACFEMSRTQGTAPLTIEFNAKCSRGVIGSYLWNFGSDAQSIERQPVHTFTTPGTYEVTLTLETDNIVSTFTDTVEVN